MTIEIDQARQTRALHPAPAGAANPDWLMVGIKAFGGAALTGGLILTGFDIVGAHVAVYAGICFVLAGIAGGLICHHAMLADRQEFYRRGQLDGWMKGWRGQEPELDDPLLK